MDTPGGDVHRMHIHQPDKGESPAKTPNKAKRRQPAPKGITIDDSPKKKLNENGYGETQKGLRIVQTLPLARQKGGRLSSAAPLAAPPPRHRAWAGQQ